ncbi:predicted protein [Plenodomus lingam JN3]|uniref:Predicted protein n=1 Tax=Leptosphaeria maculans (strain JN3 / isolate v23.1.3 / race Av1-4-5-6-7-8) TaxID=985895 RepID=E4ZT98_LEPMJ|nr:predicted protein [Plenodomus lingam JN3]CBX90040.1 predicted protein [Plenodomus lingam JN3]
MTITGDDLPQFQPGCVCDLTLAMTSQVSHALTPFWKHAPLPQIPGGLSSHCPCTISSAVWRLKQGLDPAFLPPSIAKFYSDDKDLHERTYLPSSSRITDIWKWVFR